MDLSRYYADREPADIFQISGYDRAFVSYDPHVLSDLAARVARGTSLGDAYRELCARVLAGDPDVRTLPPNSPQWRRAQGQWRPVAAAAEAVGAT